MVGSTNPAVCVIAFIDTKKNTGILMEKKRVDILYDIEFHKAHASLQSKRVFLKKQDLGKRSN